MQDIKNVIQSQSYTNRDFNSVFSELLDLTKQLCKTWDPTISNESDPGVVLLKLNALIEDKLAYATDKNVLEAFPLSVTQETNARQLFNQLGYYMGWYNSAETYITVQWKGEEALTESCPIAKFTMVTNDDSDIVYTLIDNDINVDVYNPCEMDLKDGSLKCKAMQGVISQYSINGETTITSAMLDSNRRLYFNEKNVAQNGIFITNVNSSNYVLWKKKDNLAVESLGNYFYEFGVSNDGTTCYIEFPEDADTLFSNGINIHYLKSLGESGNINAGTMSKMYSSVKTSSGVLLDSSNTKISNIYSATNGKNPETINEAYAGYKKVKGTFNTLVTLRDYINYILKSGLVSNGFVCDRTNDIQDVTKVMSFVGGVNQLVNVVAVESSQPKLSAFDLKLYLLNYASISDLDDLTVAAKKYNSTFDLLYSANGDQEYSTDQTIAVKNYIADSKCMQHNYKKLELVQKSGSTITKPNICLFKNKYPITCTIIPQYSLTTAQITEVKNAIKLALYKAFNAQQVEFGTEISYDYVKEVIEKAHDRIKSVSLNPITYETYAVYFDTDSSSNIILNEVLISSDTGNSSLSTAFRKDIYSKSVLQGVTPFYVKDTEFDYKIKQTHDGTFPSAYTTAIHAISTETKVTFKESYECRKNEAIQLYSPNLLTTYSYNNRCIYEHKLNSSIAENTNHQLASGEYLIMYWKDAESDNNYNYKIYEGSDNPIPIICPNFELSTANNSTDADAGTRLSDLRNGANISKWSSWVSENLTGAHILTTSKKIDIKKINNITIDPTYYCYWITNNIENDKYQLKFTGGKYNLGENEYFFYTSSAATDLVILGQGTELNYSGSESNFEVPVLDSDTIFNEGLSALSEIWTHFTSNLTIIENKIIDLPEGYTLSYTFPSGSTASPWLTLNKSGTELNSTAIIKYIDTTGTETKIENLNIPNIKWSARILVGINANANETIHLLPKATGTNIDQNLSEPQKLTYYYKKGSSEESGNIVGEKYIVSSIPINVSGLIDKKDIRVIEDDDYIYAKFYTFKDTTDTSTGGVNDGNTQIKNGTIEINDNEIKINVSHTFNIPTIANATINFETFRKKVLPTAAATYTFNGTKSGDVWTWKLNDVEVNLAEYGLTYTGTQTTTDTITVQVSFKSAATEYTFKFKLPTGKYIYYINQTKPLGNNAELNLYIDSTGLKEVGASDDDPVTNMNTAKKYYLYNNYTAASGSNYNIFKIRTLNISAGFTLIIQNPYKFDYPDLPDDLKPATGDPWKDIEKIITDFIKDNNIEFNYIYEIDENDAIKNPLDAYSFIHNNNHIYNKFTICQLDTTSLKNLQVTGK